MSDLVGNPEDRFSRVAAQLVLGSNYDTISNEIDQIMSRLHLSRLVGNPTMWFPNRSDTNRPVQAQKRARSLKFRI